MNNLKDIELIDQYLNGQLPATEAQDFAQRLQNEPELMELLEDFQGSDELFKLGELSYVKAELDKYDYNNINNKGWSKTVLSVASLAIISAGIVGTLLYQKTGTNNTIISDAKVPQVEQERKLILSNAPKALPESSTKEKAPVKIERAPKQSANLPVPVNSEKPAIVESEPITVLPLIAADKPVAKPIEKIVPAVNCNEQIRVKFSTEASCTNAAEGSIHVNEINGGSSPYIMTLNGHDIKGGNGNFVYLSPGTYNVTITDAQGCVKTLHKVEIKAKDCTPKEEKIIKNTKNYLVSLSEQSWTIPSCPEKGTFEIKNQQGAIIFSSEVAADVHDTWNLMESNGGMAATGIYFYRLVDLQTKSETIGTITVIQ